MPYYDKLPSDWQTEIEKKTGMRLLFETVYDPDDMNLLLSGKYNIISMTPFEFIRDIDIEQGFKNHITEVTLTFNDPDQYFSTKNLASPFHNLILSTYEDITAETTHIKITKENDITLNEFEFVYLRGYDQVNITEKSELIQVVSFSEHASYYVLVCKGIVNNYRAGSFVYTRNSENKYIQLRLKNPNCDKWISCYKGLISKPPESVNGQGIIVTSNLLSRKIIEKLVGAETGDDDKLMVYDDEGSYVDSTDILDTSSGTFDRTKVKVLDNCRLGLWKATFVSATQYILDGPGVDGLSGTINNGFRSDLQVDYEHMAFDSNYIYVIENITPYTPSIHLKIIDVSDPDNMSVVSTTNLSGNVIGQTAKDIVISGNYAFILDEYALYSIDISNKSAPAYSDTVVFSNKTSKMSLNGNYIVVTDILDVEVNIIDISTPTAMSKTGEVSLGAQNLNWSEEYPVYSSGNYAYVIMSGNGNALKIIDMTTPASPSVIGTLAGFANCEYITKTGNYLIITCTDGKVYSVNVSTPASPSLSDTFEGIGYPNFLNGAKEVYILGNYAYIACENDKSLVAVNVSDPTAMELYEAITDANGNHDALRYLDVTTNYVFVKGTDGKLAAYRVDPPASSRPGGNQITLNPDVWGGTWAEGDWVTFITAKNYKNLNPATILYDLEITRFGLNSKDIWASSFFGEKNIGTLKNNYAAGTTVIQIKIDQPAWVKTSETLIITEGSTIEEVTVATGIYEEDQYPPFIQISISALSNSYSNAAVVTWKQRGSADTDFNLDSIYGYCDTNSLALKLTLDTEMSYMQAIETVLCHCDAYLFSDNWGREKVHIFKAYSASIGTLEKNTNLVKPNPEIRTLQSVNKLEIRYGYNYTNHSGEPLKFKKYYPSDYDINDGLGRVGTERKKEMRFPGFFSETPVDLIAGQKYNVWKSGPNVINFSSILHCILLTCGDVISIDSEFPEIETDLMIIGFSLQFLDQLNFQFWGLDAKKVFKSI